MKWDVEQFKCVLNNHGELISLGYQDHHDLAHIESICTAHPLGERWCVTLYPHQEVMIESTQLEFHYKVSKETAMVFNGYQSWTDTQPLFVNDKMPYLSPLAKPLVSKYQFDKYGDTLIKSFKHGRGQFHGFTYVTLSLEHQTTLCASLHEASGFTIFEYDHKFGKWTINKDNSGLSCSQPTCLLDIVVLKGEEPQVFDTYFEMMNIKLKTKEAHTGWTSWYYHYQNINENIILHNLKVLSDSKAQLDIIQIDDGYQTAIGDWLRVDETKFPHGMAHVASKIQSKGFKAGIWLAPCVCEVNSVLAKEHPQWLLKDEFGQPHFGGGNWGGFYILDMQNEEVKEYIKHVFDVVLNDWAFDMVKLDFLYAACLYPSSLKTRGQIMHETMVFIRSCVKDKLILGCGVPLGSAFGLVDFCRIGCDVGLDYNDKWYMKWFHRERISTYHAINNAIGRFPLHGRAFLNDPDVFILRDEANELAISQKHTLAMVNKMMHGLLFTSDDVATYDEEARKIFEWLMQHDHISHHKIRCIKKGVYAMTLQINGENKNMWVNTLNKPFKNNTVTLQAYETKLGEDV